MEEKDAEDENIDKYFDEGGPYHFLFCCVSTLSFMDSLYINIKVFILKFEAEHYEGYCVISELD